MLNRLLLILLSLTSGARAADAPEQTFDLTIARGVALKEQRLIRVEKGAAVKLRISSDAAGEIHLHGYRLEAHLAPGKLAEIAFAAHATGRYRIEWHAAGEPAGKGGGHHSAPLATLEVRPK